MARSIPNRKGKTVSIAKFKFSKEAFFRLLSYIKPYKLRMIIVCICIMTTSIVAAYMSVYIKIVIDDFITPMLSQAKPDFTPLLHSIIRYGIILIISVIATLIQSLLMVDITQSVIRDIRDQMFERMQHFPISYFDTNKTGDIMSHYTNDVDTLREFFERSVAQIINTIIAIIAILFSMLLISIDLTVIVLIGMFLILKYSSFIASNSGKHFFKAQESIGELNAFIEEMINGSKEVKSFCYEEENKKHFSKRNNDWRVNSTSAHTYASILMPSLFGLGNYLYIVIAIIGAVLAVISFPNFCLQGKNVITLGTITAFLMLTRAFLRPIAETSSQMNVIMQAFSGAERIFIFLDKEFECDEGKIELNKNDVKGEVVFQNVYFSYNPEIENPNDENSYVLKDISIHAKAGQKIALVGHTGAGKTTITNLINRFYDVNKGNITYDGIDIKEYTKYSLRNSLSVVLQEVNLFTGTVIDNIRYGNLDATDEECIKAAKMANADSFIRMLPDGYYTLITGGGASLSQGQRQLISIARAIIADPKVLILDEATSSIDTRTEKLISKGMDQLMENRTVFVIAHRLSTIKNAKAIMVMEDGKIIERGNHETLIAQKGKYYELYTGNISIE